MTNDASSVGWNPALLANDEEFDLLLALPYNSAFSTLGGWGAFLKIDNLAFGYTSSINNFAPGGIRIPQSAYAGYGLAFDKDHFWMGAGIRYLDTDKDALRYNVSALYSPKPGYMFSAGYDNMYSPSGEDAVLSFSAAWSFYRWLTAHGTFRYALKNPVLNGNSFSPELGVSTNVLDDHIIASLSLNPALDQIRIGVEFAVSQFMAGSINDASTASSASEFYTGGTALLRFLTTEKNAIASGMGRRPGFSGYRSDATCTPGAYQWQTATDDSPANLLRILNSAGSDYGSLADQIKQYNAVPKAAFDSVYARYYERYAPRIKESGKTQDLIGTTIKGTTVLTLETDSSQKPLIVSTLHVRDELGRNVTGLEKRNFYLNDKNVVIAGLTQTVSKSTVPVDIVVLMDCSGSMGDEIVGVRNNVNAFVRSLSSRGADYRIGGILYGEKIYSTLQPTSSIAEFEKFFLDATARGSDEITSTAIHEAATSMNFRAGAQRIFILITDDCSIQENGEYTEASLTRELWDSGARLYSVINPQNHNGGIMTRLSYGRDYSINKPFTAILDDISGDITTTYQITYKPVEKTPPPRITLLRGTVRDTEGYKPQQGLFELKGTNGKSLNIRVNPITGEYESAVSEGQSYSASLNFEGYEPLQQTVDLSSTRKGDTVVKDFILKMPETMLQGSIKDQNGNPIAGKLKIEDALSLEQINNLATDKNGAFSVPLKEGRAYRLVPSAPEHVGTNVELDMRSTKRGAVIRQDLTVTAIQVAVEKGMTFTLKNIFFDSGKWDVRPESAKELEKLMAFLSEYKSVRIEIGAHTDAIGSDEANQTLSRRRAESVVQFLVARGVGTERLIARGYGESIPVAGNDTEEGREKNRRVEFKLIK